MILVSEKIENLRKRNLGKYLYTIYQKVDGDGNILHSGLDRYIGQIKEVNEDCSCLIYNHITNKETTMNLVDLNNRLVNLSYYLSSKFINTF